MSAGSAFGLGAYLARIGCTGHPSIAELHHAHVTAIPFENLDPHRGVPVSLDAADLQLKLVAARRGGYCFEHNLLLRAALQALGYDVDMYLARVRYGAPEGVVRPRGHLVLRVHTDSGALHADVGFGLGSPLEPLPWGPGSEHDCGGWSHRVAQDGSELVLQQREQGEWVDLYGFVAEPVPMIDIETANWWVCTHPRSPFVTGLIAAVQDAAGTRTALSDWDSLSITERTAEGASVEAVARHEVPALLADRFGLPGFALDADGRVVRA
jgi:N-hydroxyarylamine O-acetyltransferase